VKFASQIHFSLLVIAFVAPTILSQTSTEKESQQSRVANLKFSDVRAPKEDWTGPGSLIDPATSINSSENVEPGAGAVESAQNYYRAGAARINDGHYKEAIASLKVALELDPHSSAVYEELGYAYFGLAEYEDSIKAYERAVSLGPTSLFTRRSLAIVYLTSKKPEQAIPPLLEASRLEPKNALNHYLLAVAYDDSDQLDNAIDQYLRSLALDPNHYRSYIGLGAIYTHQSRS